jgi:glycosyltransferase involved in cell wall biosynthesis
MLDTIDYWAERYDIEPAFVLRKPLKSLATELTKRGWKYYELDYTFWSDAVPPTKPEDIFHRAVQNNQAIKAIEAIIQDTNPDVVMTNSIVCPWAALAAYFQKKPHVWFVREYGDLDHGRVFEMDRERTFEDIGNLSDLVVTNSRTLAEHVGQYVPATKLTALYTPFKVDELIARATEKVASPYKLKDSLKLVITGNLAPSKGQREAAQAVSELVKDGHQIELCAIGSTDQKKYVDELMAIAAQNGATDNIHLVGYQSNPMAYINASDAGIMASRKEAFGRVTFEYLLLGKPVIGANGGATPEMVKDGKTGYLYDPSDVESLKTALTHYLNDKSQIAGQSEAAKKMSQTMLSGDYNADALFARVKELAEHGADPTRRPINYFHRELDYVDIAQEIINNSGSQSVKKLVRLKARRKAKATYYKLRSAKTKLRGK